jgi:putative restriction endonuclease
MPQIFVFAIGKRDKHAQRNLANSIEISIDEQMVYGSFPSAQRDLLEHIREEGNGFYAWGAVPGPMNQHHWKLMKPGDYVLCVSDNVYHYAARVLAKYNRPQFAKRVWGTRDDGKTWQYLYFLTEPDEVDGHVFDTARYLRKGYFGFIKISDANTNKILSDFGSVDNFIHQRLNGPESGVGTKRGLAPATEQDLDKLENTEGLNKTDVNRDLATIRNKLTRTPKLREGLKRQTTRTTAMLRSAAFEIGVKRLYGFRCAICGSGLRTPNGKPEVQSAHIYPKGRDGSDDVRNGICLCRRHHWAMDAGWISIADDYTILVREDLPDHDDYRFIGEYKGEKIRLPSTEEAAPHTIFLQQHRKLTKFE